MSYWPVGNKYVGVIHPVDAKQESGATLRIWIEDQSGSMDWAVRQVAEDMCAHLKDLPLGDLISVGYFSGVGDFRWFVKNARLSTPADYESIAKIIRANARSRGTTCFSEILADVPKVIEEVSSLVAGVELVFLTDGHPVVPSYPREHSAIFSAIKSIKGKITSGLLCGYGDYYNRPLMVEMAQALGATLQHADKIEQFGQELGKIVVKTGKKRTTITLPAGVEAAFAVENGRVVIYAVENNAVVAPTGTSVYFVTKDAGQERVDPIKASKVGDPYQHFYASALVALQKGEVGEALSILGDVGDVAIVEKLGSAMTNKEFGDVESMLQDAATDVHKRFLKGQVKGCAPKEDAFDLIDLLNLLQSDPEAKFYPNRPEFVYKRTGRKSERQPGYPDFVADENVAVPISGLVGNSEELNISISLQIPGKVNLPEEAVGLKRDAIGLPEVFDAHVWRTFSIVSNALLNVTQLPASVSEKTFDELKKNGVLPMNLVWQSDDVYVLDLQSVPACNRARGKNACDWSALAKDAVSSMVMGNQIKVYKSKLNELDPDKSFKRPVTVTEDQQKFLEACGIKPDGTYAPPTTTAESTDVMKIRTFEVKVEKSSPVTMKDFNLMTAGTKKVNWAGEQMKIAHNLIEKSMPKATGLAVLWLNEHIDVLKAKKRQIDAEINAKRYAIALGGYWRKYHTSEEATYSVDCPEFDTVKTANVTFVFKDDVEKKI